MKERSILFRPEMVRAILEGRKTQTRRVMKSQPYTLRTEGFGYPTKAGGFVSLASPHCLAECPYGVPGDRLWVKETFNVGWLDGGKALYRADGGSAKDAGYPSEPKWKPAIFMPRNHSRITLEITDVRVQRLQEISEDDAAAEGVYRGSNGHYADYPEGETVPGWAHARESFRTLWVSINAKSHPWASNPFCWALTFRRLP